MSFLYIAVLWGIWLWATFFMDKTIVRWRISALVLCVICTIPYSISVTEEIGFSLSYVVLALGSILYLLHPTCRCKSGTIVFTVWCGGMLYAGLTLWYIYDPIVLHQLLTPVTTVIFLVTVYSFSTFSIWDRLAKSVLILLFSEVLLAISLHHLAMYEAFLYSGNGEKLAYVIISLFAIEGCHVLWTTSRKGVTATYQQKRESDTLYE